MKKIALFLMAAVAVIACNPNDTVVPGVEITSTQTTIPQEGSEDMSFKVNFKSTVAWTASIKETQDWCSISPSSGEAGDASVTIIALPNPDKGDRTVTLVLTAGTAVEEVILTQLPVSAFELVASEAFVDEKAGTYELKVMTNVPYTVTIEDADWVTVADTKAPYAENVTTLNYTAYDVVEGRRTASVIISAEGLEDLEFTFMQDGPAAKIWGLDLTTVASRHGTVTNAANETFGAMYSLALFGDDLVLCVGDGSAPILLNKATGEKKGTLNVGDIKPMSIANDDAGNLILADRVYNYWTSYEFYNVWYIKAGTTDVVPLFDLYNDLGLYTSYLGAGLTVRGDVTKNAVIATAYEGVVDVSGECTLVTFDVVNGAVSAYNKLALTGFTTLSWWPGYWVAAPGNYPGFVFLGTSASQGGLMAGYDANKLNQFDASGVCTLASDVALADGNYAANSLEIREVAGKQYLGVACGCHFPNYGIAPNIAVYDLETQNAVATPRTTNYALTGEKDEKGNPTYHFGVAATSDMCIEETTDGFTVYYVDNNCSAIEAFHYVTK